MRGRARSRALGPVGLLVVALAAGLVTATVVDDAARRQAAWGETRRVAVATRDLEPGAVVAPDSFAWAERPVTVVPEGTEAQDPSGRVVVDGILQGEVIPPRRLAPAGTRGLAALVPAQRVALSVPRDARTPPLEPGQRVDLHAGPTGAEDLDHGAWDGTPDGTSGGALRLARRAPVLQVGERQVTVAVADDEAAAVVGALVGGTVIVALTAG